MTYRTADVAIILIACLGDDVVTGADCLKMIRALSAFVLEL